MHTLLLLQSCRSKDLLVIFIVHNRKTKVDNHDFADVCLIAKYFPNHWVGVMKLLRNNHWMYMSNLLTLGVNPIQNDHHRQLIDFGRHKTSKVVYNSMNVTSYDMKCARQFNIITVTSQHITSF